MMHGLTQESCPLSFRSVYQVQSGHTHLIPQVKPSTSVCKHLSLHPPTQCMSPRAPQTGIQSVTWFLLFSSLFSSHFSGSSLSSLHPRSHTHPPNSLCQSWWPINTYYTSIHCSLPLILERASAYTQYLMDTYTNSYVPTIIITKGAQGPRMQYRELCAS